MNRWSISERRSVKLSGGSLGFRYVLQLLTPEGAIFQWRGCLVGISPARGPWTLLPRAGRFESCTWNQRAQQICLDALRDAGVLDELLTSEREKPEYPDICWEEDKK